LLRQLAKLTRRVPAAGPRALALAIYADASGALIAAPGEGVACVDDAARAVELLTMVWQATGSQRIREWAEGLFDFVLWMHRADGTWINFISEWSGEINRDGATSAAGVNFWQARGLSAAVTAGIVLGDERARPVVELGFAAASAATVPADVRSLHLLARQRWLDAGNGGDLARAQISGWADEIADSRNGDVLTNSPDETGTPHLWAHIQEAALVSAASSLGRPDLLAVAEDSALALFAPAIESGFALPHVQPYDVQAATLVMEALTVATKQVGYADLAALSREWFEGRNPSGAPVYDRIAGRVADGIDEGKVSRNSGAESNVMAGIALLDDAVSIARRWAPRVGAE
jgi:hypothetical protein